VVFDHFEKIGGLIITQRSQEQIIQDQNVGSRQ
jgi:hypothetical protein